MTPLKRLSKRAVPPDADWLSISGFALTFDGYEHFGSSERCAEVANNVQHLFHETGALPNNLDTLRGCLFYEQRRWRHFDETPDGEAWRYIQALVAAIRNAIPDEPARKELGLRNSSITRVRPFFQTLIQRDRTGESWLPALMELAGVTGLPRGPLNVQLTEKRSFFDSIWRCRIDLERCFEYSLAPPTALLQWMIEHPDRLVWPTGRTGQRVKYSDQTTHAREALLGDHGEQEQLEGQAAALECVRRMGGVESARRWWAFEGFSQIDCYLETPAFALLVEGKRTERIASRVSWLPGRNQIVRNLDCAFEKAGDRRFYALSLVENPTDEPTREDFAAGLPHRSESERSVLRDAYLGQVTWNDACQRLRVGPLPNSRLDIPSPCEQEQ